MNLTHPCTTHRETGAILTYLVEEYDPEHRISAATEEDKYKQLQWLFFQTSGQGPYFGQYSWFKMFHHEKIPSAVERYKNEIERVFGVLDGVLSKQEWLVAGKPTVADFAFVQYAPPRSFAVRKTTLMCGLGTTSLGLFLSRTTIIGRGSLR